MRTIKTRSRVKVIKALDKSVNLSKRMKDSFARAKEKAEESQNPSHATPSEYASENLQSTAQGVIHETVYHLPNSREKAAKNWNSAKNHFQEVKNQFPKERRTAANLSQKAAVKARENADKLSNVSDKAKDTVKQTQTSVKDAKQTLKQVRIEGRQTLKEVRQSAKCEIKNFRFSVKPAAAYPARSMSNTSNPTITLDDNAHAGGSHTRFMGRRTLSTKNNGDAVSAAERSTKSIKSTKKVLKDTAKGSIKTTKKSVKTAEKSAKSAVRTAQQAAKVAKMSAHTSAKTAITAERTARATIRAAIKTAKATTKAIIALIKATIATIKGLIAIIAAGGWVAVFIILIMCLIGLMVGSIFGIFFSSEPDHGTGLTINSVITEINAEYTGQIDAIITANAHDLLDMSGARASWKQVLAVYTVRTVSDPDNPMEVATMNDEKATILRTVFWDMNTISNTLDIVEVDEDILDDDGLPTGETVSVSTTVLRIIVTHKTSDEMTVLYGFTDEQIAWQYELLKPEYHSLWNALLYGVFRIGDGTMIEIADTQIGNVGGEIYWRWYGFSSRVEWCAIFVSWCAEQSGFAEAGIIPRFSLCTTGAQWFKDMGQWYEPGYTPVPGDIVFFDWEPDGITDHVGIVESVADGRVNTIEGNSSDAVARRSYDLNSDKIYGYGVPDYN